MKCSLSKMKKHVGTFPELSQTQGTFPEPRAETSFNFLSSE
jgi:hypothetical protein